MFSSKAVDRFRKSRYRLHKQAKIYHKSAFDRGYRGGSVHATVSRAIRKCGFPSFSEMKYRLSEEVKDNAETYEMNRVLSKSYTECVETIKRIDIPSVIKVVQMIREASLVYIIANGITALIANEFAIQLQCQKIRVCVICDSVMMRKMELFATENDLVFTISVKNSAPEVAIGARLARKREQRSFLAVVRQEQSLMR